MTSSPPQAPVPIQRGRRDERTLLARLRVERLWNLRHREPLAGDLGLLIVRVAVGVTFLAHGVDKVLDFDATRALFASLGIPAPGAMAPLVALTETIGGLLLIAGRATPLAGVALAGDMLVAYLTAHVGHGFFVSEGGGELVLLLGAARIAPPSSAANSATDADSCGPRTGPKIAVGLIAVSRVSPPSRAM